MTEKSNFKLDNRIESIDDIQTIISNNRGSIGCKGFFFDNFVQAKVLTKTHYGTLVDIDDNDDNDHCFKARCENDFVGYFRLFIPEDALKPAEKKYRAFTLQEFKDKFKIGEIIRFRRKDDHIEYNFMFSGWIVISEDDSRIQLGDLRYPPEILFTNYELFYSDRYVPFGVEE